MTHAEPMFVLGIAGGSGSGKSTIVEQLLHDIGDEFVAHLPHDAYYFNRTDMPPHVRETNNWDDPAALDNLLFVEHLRMLAAGRTIERPIYDFSTHSRTTETVRVVTKPVLIVEGILIFAIQPLRDLLHLKVFIDTPADLRILRRAERDVSERGRSLPSVIEQYIQTVRPMHDQFVEPSRRHADIVVPWELRNTIAISVLAAKIREHTPDDDVTDKAV
jgi:uridine kinase